MPGHHTVEEMPDAGEMLFARGDAEALFPEPVEVAAHVGGRDAGQFEAAALAPREESMNGAPVGEPCVLVANGAVEEFLGREDGDRAGPLHELRQRRRG